MKNCEPLLRIAIDGPGGAGKSTIAKLLAARYDIPYVDTGAMYRAVGLKMTRLGLPFEESDELTAMLDSTDIDFVVENVILDGEDVSGLIRTQEISAAASACSKLASVRKKLVALQKEMGKVRSVVMDGRDIGTNVMPDAEFKFYITASARERARRRYLELINKGEHLSIRLQITIIMFIGSKKSGVVTFVGVPVVFDQNTIHVDIISFLRTCFHTGLLIFDLMTESSDFE